MSSRAAFFDLDATLITVTSIFRFLAFDQEPGRYDRAMADLLARKANGASRVETNRAFYRNFAGRHRDELMAAGERWFDTELRTTDPFFRPDALAALRAHQAEGELTVLISGSFAPCVEPIVKYLGIDLVRCTELVLRDGVCTGEVVTPMVGEHKAQAVLEVAREHDLALADCAAYGDDVSDLPMLALVGRPFLLGDNENVRK
ncbi:MAG TPA: HAD family hydrolase [Pseudonocardiaceae bacterium]|nr:HAD family hydrolase [Pseudonocardiaceae bacterium]